MARLVTVKDVHQYVENNAPMVDVVVAFDQEQLQQMFRIHGPTAIHGMKEMVGHIVLEKIMPRIEY